MPNSVAPPDPDRTIVVWVPDWPVFAMEGENPDPAAVAVIEKGLVLACSAAARAAGIRRGLRLREAQARCPDLVTVAYDPILDLRRFEPVIALVEQLMPGVQVIRAGMCAVRARGPSRFYGGEQKTAALLVDRLRSQASPQPRGQADGQPSAQASPQLDAPASDQARIRPGAQPGSDTGSTDSTGSGAVVPDCRIGIADGLFAAEQAARSTSAAAPICIIPPGDSARFLAPLPVTALGVPSLAALLPKLGMHTLGAFATLDEVQVRHRFGESGSRAHALAGATSRTVVVPRAVQKQLDVAVDFEPPLDRADQIAFALRGAAERFTGRFAEQYRVCTAIRVRIDSEQSVSERVWLHPRWFTAADVVDRVRWQLQPSGTDSGLEAAVVRVEVSPENVDTVGNHEEGLWSTAPDERIHHGLARVQGMLGHDAVLTAAIGGGRMLEDRQLLVPWGDRPPARTEVGPWPGSLPPPLPGSVFTPPLAARVVDHIGESVGVDARGGVTAAPVRVQVTAALTPIVAWAGPWPVEERWWDAHAARAVNRFQVVDAAGCAWLLLEHHRVWQAEARYD